MFTINRDLIDKYTTQGPRYTSYPTAPHWKKPFNPEIYLNDLALTDPNEAFSLYTHIPFCSERCLFCGCNVVITRNYDRAQKYLHALYRELDLLAEHLPSPAKLAQLHWGGGTPNYLSPKSTTELFNKIYSTFTIKAGAEISVECDPRVIDDELMETYRNLGFNRISFGVQDFDPKVQQAIKRVQPYDMTTRVVEKARELKFEGINVDLIYGLPYQTLQSFETTLNQVKELDPDRLALYSYAHVPWVRPHQKAMPEEAMPQGNEKLDIFLRAIEFFTDNGFEYIGLDHFAKPEDELMTARQDGTLGRNFMGYTIQKTGTLLGTGVSGISMSDTAYVQNSTTQRDYEEEIEEHALPYHRGIYLTEDDRIRRDTIQTLMCYGALDVRTIEEKHNIDFYHYFSGAKEQLNALADDQLVNLTEHNIEATDMGRLLIRNVAMIFDGYETPKGIYSSTV